MPGYPTGAQAGEDGHRSDLAGKGGGRRGERRAGEGRGWAAITFTCPEPSPPVELSLDLLPGLKGAGAEGRGHPPRVTQVASFYKRMSSPPPQRSFTIHPLDITDETNHKEKLL